MTLTEWRLIQAREALAWNQARAALPDWQRAACVRAEMALGEIARRQGLMRNHWTRRAAERDLEQGNGGL